MQYHKIGEVRGDGHGEQVLARITAFPSAVDVSPNRAIQVEFKSLAELKHWLIASKITTEEKRSVVLFTRGRCAGHRAKRSISGPMLVLLDCDKTAVTPEECHARLTALGVPHILVTTFSHGRRPGENCYRVFADALADSWGELEVATRQLGEITGIDRKNPFTKGSPLDRASLNGPAFFSPAVHPDRAGAYRLLAHLPTGAGDWAPRWVELVQPDPDRTKPTDTGGALLDPLEVEAALEHIENQDREQWFEIGMALHSTGHEDARAIWDRWSASQGYHDFSADVQETVWRSFHDLKEGESGITLGTLFHLAREGGWAPAPRTRTSPLEDFLGDADERIQLLYALNRRYAYVTNLGGSGKVVDLGREAGQENEPIAMLGTRAFVTAHHHPKIWSGEVNADGTRTRPKALGEVWLNTWPMRRTFRRIDFLPPGPEQLRADVLNLWRGWPHQAGPEGCDLFLQHVLEVICDGDEELYRWVVAWMADLIQNPAIKVGTAIVMHGDEGIGKGIFGTVLLDLCGVHGIHVTQTDQLTGQFNAHLSSALVTFADEVIWGGNRQAEGVLKSMVTDTMATVQYKGVDSFRSRSFSRLVIASNGDWVIPAGRGARRWQVLEVSPHRKRDKAYFDALLDEVDPRRAGYRGGLSGLMRFLQGIDLTSGEWPDPRVIIATDALAQQKIESMRDEARWMLTSLQRGSFGEGNPWPGPDSEGISTGAVYDSYLDAAKQGGTTHKRVEMLVSRYLKKLFGRPNKLGGTMKKSRPRDPDTGKYVRTFRFPPLEACRAAFELDLGSSINWDDEDDLEDGERLREG